MQRWWKRRASTISNPYQRLKRKSVYRFFLTYLFMILALTAAILLAVFPEMRSQMREKSVQNSYTLLRQIELSVDAKLNQITEIASKLAFHQQIPMLLQGRTEVYSLSDFVEDVRILQNDAIFDLYLYSPLTDQIFTPGAVFSAEDFYRTMYHYNGITFSEWKETYLCASEYRRFYPLETLKIYYNQTTYQEMFTYTQALLPSVPEQQRGRLVLLLRRDVLLESVSALRETSSADILLYDKSGRCVFSSCAGALPQEAELQIQDAVHSYGSGTFSAEGRSRYLSYKVSQNTGWKYVMLFDEEDFFEPFREQQYFILSLILIVLLVGVAAAVYFSHRLYSPIREMADVIAKRLNGVVSGSSSEVQLVRDSLFQTLNRCDQIETAIQNNIPFLRTSYLNRLLNTVSLNESREMYQKHLLEYKIDFVSDIFAVAVVQLENEGEFFEQFTEAEYALALVAVTNVAEEIFTNEGHSCYWLRMDDTQLALVVSIFDMNADMEYSQVLWEQTAQRIFDLVSGSCSIGISMGLSQAHRGYQQLAVCCDEAKKAIAYRVIRGGCRVFRYREIAFVGLNYYYPYETELRLVNEIRKGNRDAAHQEIDGICQMNFVGQQIGPEAKDCLLTALISTFIRAMNLSPVPSPECREEISFDRYYREVRHCADIPAVVACLYAIVDELCEYAVRERENAPGGVAAEIAAYVVEHAGDPDLCLSQLGERFDLSVPYISSIFKKFHGENLKDYIAKIRLERAKDLLKNTELVMQEIAARVGLNNEVTLNRMFRKYLGISPGEYRRQLQQDEGTSS